jgi:hypothetical protein
MQQDLVGHTLYCLYELFFTSLDQAKLVLLAQTSKEINYLMINSGGFAKSIYFDQTCSFNDFFERLSTHTRIDKMTFDGSGINICILEFLPVEGIKTLILKDHDTCCLIRENMNQNKLKPPPRRRRLDKAPDKAPDTELGNVTVQPFDSNPAQSNCWAGLEYLFIADNARPPRAFDIGMKNFPNLRFVGSHKASIMFDGNEGGVDQLPYVMAFKDAYSFELMHKKKKGALPKIINLLKRIYR